MLREDPEAMLAAWKNIFIKLLGFLALVLMTGILLNLIMALLALTATVLAGIYPPGHFDTSTKLTEKNFDAHVKEQVDAGKTLFVRWIASEG